jgi:hypothetical protein
MACGFLPSEFEYSDLFDYLSNWTSSQVEQKTDYLDQNG